MSRLSMLLPNPAPDLAGACSLLFALGGMTVIHDAAGCMENYAVFDEPRWFGARSMVYSSALTHMEAVLGDERRLIDRLAAAALEEKPAFTAIVGSPVPRTLGMDIEGMAAETEAISKILSLGLSCGGFAPYGEGISAALLGILKKFCKTSKRPGVRRLGLLGAAPLDISQSELAGIKALLERAGWSVGAPLCMGASLEDVKNAACVDANLAVSYGGLEAARWMERKFSIPFAAGIPITARQAGELEKLLSGGGDSPAGCGKRCLVLGEQVFARSVASALRAELGADARAGVTMSFDAALADEYTLRLSGESEIAAALAEDWALVIGDPLYTRLLPENTSCGFVPRPHAALSSRLCGGGTDLNKLFTQAKEKLK